MLCFKNGNQVLEVCRKNQLTGFHMIDTQDVKSFLPTSLYELSLLIRIVFKCPCSRTFSQNERNMCFTASNSIVTLLEVSQEESLKRERQKTKTVKNTNM